MFRKICEIQLDHGDQRDRLGKMVTVNGRRAKVIDAGWSELVVEYESPMDWAFRHLRLLVGLKPKAW